jgi:hypothetical protein
MRGHGDSFKGATFVELLIAMAIFTVVMTAVFSAYINLTRYATDEYRLAESGMETELAKNIIERDIMMAGYGLADDYGEASVNPRPVQVTGEGPNYNLLLRGTAIGILSKSSQGWSYIKSVNPTQIEQWDDERENISYGDRVIYLDPSTREILTIDLTAVFQYPKSPYSLERGVIVYGLHSNNANLPYYTVKYSLGGTPPSICAPGTRNLLRAESKDYDPPVSGQPIMNCVRNFQIAFGLDTMNEDGVIDMWDPSSADAYETRMLGKIIKQIRVHILVQNGNYDPLYIYSNPDTAMHPDMIHVGDSVAGNDITLTERQRNYRWKVISINVTPRNLR